MNHEYVLHEEEKDGLTLKIIQDQDGPNPRTDYEGHLGTMMVWWNGYTLGDKNEYKDPVLFLRQLWIDHATLEEKRKAIIDAKLSLREYRGLIKYCGAGNIEGMFEELYEDQLPKDFPAGVYVLPLYVYEHGGITISTGSFSCQWDSGMAGWIYTTDAKIKEVGAGFKKEDGTYTYTDYTPEQVYASLESEVEEYDKYLTGDCWYYVIEDENGDYIDSCGGFLGDEYAREEAQSAFEHALKDKKQAEWDAVHKADPNLHGKF